MGQNCSKGEDYYKKGQVTSKMCTYTNLIIYFLGTGVNAFRERNFRNISVFSKELIVNTLILFMVNSRELCS